MGPSTRPEDVDWNVKIELGRTRMLIEDVLRLTEGSVVELDKLAGDPVQWWMSLSTSNSRAAALVLNDNFCVLNQRDHHLRRKRNKANGVSLFEAA